MELPVEEADQEADLQVIEEKVPLHRAGQLQERTDHTLDQEVE